MAKRLFISVKISEPAREELRRVEEKLKRENQRMKITWVNPEVMHLTLHFLGDCEETVIEQIQTGLLRADNSALAMTPTPRLTLGSLGAFPNPREPRVIIVHTRDEGGRLAKIQQALGQELAKIGLAIDSRPFKSHLTLGRVKNQSGRLGGLELPVSPVSWEVKSIELMGSKLTPSGPTHTELFSAVI